MKRCLEIFNRLKSTLTRGGPKITVWNPIGKKYFKDWFENEFMWNEWNTLLLLNWSLSRNMMLPEWVAQFLDLSFVTATHAGEAHHLDKQFMLSLHSGCSKIQAVHLVIRCSSSLIQWGVFVSQIVNLINALCQMRQMQHQSEKCLVPEASALCWVPGSLSFKEQIVFPSWGIPHLGWRGGFLTPC